MTMLRQDQVGRCDFLDLLEDAAVTKKRVEIELRSGEVFTDEIRDVATREGQEFVSFLEHDELPLKEILGAKWARPTHH